MAQERLLAAIMFTDLVGYTSLMQKDEEKAIESIKRHRLVLEKNVSLFNGQLIEYFGDGSLCIFLSVTDAARCAIAIQQELLQPPVIPLRIGIHIGEIIREGDKIMGDGVNLASRIQSLGEAGSVLVSKEISDKIKNRSEFQLTALGHANLKNVSEPMEVFALSNTGLTVPKVFSLVKSVSGSPSKKRFTRSRLILLGAVALSLAVLFFVIPAILYRQHFTGNEKSIAVLPFENMSTDSSQEYFSDGITEEIIAQLSQIRGLKVISRTSVMQYKGSKQSLKEVARELNVAAILEGSVRKEGNKIRITAQLIDANTDQHIWTRQYDKTTEEVFDIQSEVAANIASELNIRLSEETGRRLKRKATRNIPAYEEYLKAKQDDPREAEKHLLSALKMDSTFALAWAQLAFVYGRLIAASPDQRPSYTRKSLAAALKAIQYGPELSESHMIFGDILKTVTLNPSLSIPELERAIKLNPNNAEAYIFLAYALIEMEKFREAEQNLLTAKQLDPLAPHTKAAWFLYYVYSGNAEKVALFNLENNQVSRSYLKNMSDYWKFFLRNQYDSLLMHGIKTGNQLAIGIGHAKTGNVAITQNLIDSLKIRDEAKNDFTIGILNAWINNKPEAIKYLNKAYIAYDYQLIKIRVDKHFDPLRNEKGFIDLLEKMGMNE
jgi:TolB-like protein/class 3 adenylate cyclase